MSSGPTFQPTLKTITATTSEPTALPTTPSPATSSASSGNSFSCSSNKWHPDMINEDGCSNSLDFPEEWLGEAIYFYSSSNECCATFFGDNECMVYNECDDGTPTTSETTSTIPQTTKTDAPDNTAATPKTTTVAPESTESPDITHDTTESTRATEPTTTEAPKVTSETATFPTTSNPSSTSTSHSPTISLAPTGKSFPCSSNQWHPDTTAKDGCSNSLHFPEEWLGQPMFFFNNSKDCCDLFLRDRSCKVYDVCENGTLSSPLLTPTQSPLPKEIQSSCPSASWHPSEDYSKCTNSFGYPEIWGSPTLISVYLFEKAEHCCAVFFEARNETCVIEDICGVKLIDDTGTISGETKTTSTSTTTPPVATSGRACDFNTPWHPSSDFTRCTNSDEYPESWILPNMREKYLFDSKERCCEIFFLVQDKNCVAEDSCLGTFTNIDPLTKTPSSRPTDYQATSGPTMKEPVSATDGACYSNTWHPSLDFTRCTNSNDYPESWNLPGMRQEYLYDSKERCCEVFFLLQDRTCVLEDSCLGVFTSIEPETKTPTNIPTENPNTHSSSENSTSPPQWPMTPLISSAPMSSEPSSLMPANSPSYSPSSHPLEVKWYPDRNPDYSKGRCINAVPIPQFRETYATLRECCDRSYAGQESGVCLSSEPTTTSSSVSHTDPKNATGSSTAQTNSTSAAVRYYSDPSSGMCAVVDKSTPLWIKMFFTDWTECCKIGWVLDACLAAAPHAL